MADVGRPVRLDGMRKAGRPLGGTGLCLSGEGYRLCWESATVTSTRWNSFSSL